MDAQGRSALTSRSFREHELLLSAITRITCSPRWRDDAWRMFADDLIAWPHRHEGAATALRRAKYYPPGGKASTMRRCPQCRRFTPIYHGDGGWCTDCREAYRPPPFIPLPSSIPLSQVVSGAVASAMLSRYELHTVRIRRRNYRYVAPFVTRQLTDVQKAVLLSAETAGRSGRRPLYLWADPRVAGGRIDDEGVMRDPWTDGSLTASSMQLPIGPASTAA